MNFFLIKKIKLVALSLFIVSTISLIGSILFHNFLVNFKVDYPVLVMSDYKDAKSGERFKLLCDENNEYCFNDYFVNRSIKKNQNLLDCNKFIFKNFFSLNDENNATIDTKLFNYNDGSRKPKKEYLEQKIYSNYFFTKELNPACIKNRTILKQIYLFSPTILEKLIDFNLNLTLGTSYKIFPFFFGETSISNIVKRYPINLIFKTCLYISVILMILYWIQYNKFFSRITKKKFHSFFMFGILSAVFLFLHVFFLGMVFESKLLKLFQKLPIIFFILNEFLSQVFLTKIIYDNKNFLNISVKRNIVTLKIIYIFSISLITLYMIFLFLLSEIDSKIEYILEWNYFTGLLIYYFLSFLMWKKSIFNPTSSKNFIS